MEGSAKAARNREPAARAVLADVSHAVQDYLREIYKLQGGGERVKTSTLARRMGVAPPSATAMVKKLAALGLADHESYRGVRLTRAGEQIALEVLRHHRLLELYLARTLELDLDAVHDEADRLEHVLSEAVELRIDEALGSPKFDPHGDPIPDARLRITHPRTKPLAALAPGEEATVERIPDGNRELLRYLARLPLVPGARVRLVEAAPVGGPLTVSTNGREFAISRELGSEIRVSV